MIYTQSVHAISRRQWLLALLSAILQALIFPSLAQYYLSWIAFVPLLAAILQPSRGKVKAGQEPRTCTVWQGFLLGYACGIVWYLCTCYWIYHVMHVYGGLVGPVAVGVLLLFSLYLGLYHGAYGLLLALAARRGQSKWLVLWMAPFLWVAVELARTLITGFPWNLLGTAQVDNIVLTQAASVTGVYGISFIIVLVNCAVAAAWFAKERRRAWLAASLVVAALLQSGALLRWQPLPATQHVLMVQHNIPLDVPWTRALLDQTLDTLASLSVLPPGSASGDDPRLILWPESPAPFFEIDGDFRGHISALARSQTANIVLVVEGAVLPSAIAKGSTPQLTNRAVLISPAGTRLAYYDKMHLVPFGEYVPFKGLFSFAEKLTRTVGDFQPGSQRSLLDMQGHKLGVFICYESVFPDEVRQFAAGGAQVLINPSNDGWYGEHGAPGQLLNMARMRAIENRRWLLRVTNTGITASIDPYGRVVAEAPRKQRLSLVVPYEFESDTTFYTRHGDWFAWACAIISIAGLLFGFRLRN